MYGNGQPPMGGTLTITSKQDQERRDREATYFEKGANGNVFNSKAFNVVQNVLQNKIGEIVDEAKVEQEQMDYENSFEYFYENTTNGMKEKSSAQANQITKQALQNQANIINQAQNQAYFMQMGMMEQQQKSGISGGLALAQQQNFNMALQNQMQPLYQEYAQIQNNQPFLQDELYQNNMHNKLSTMGASMDLYYQTQEPNILELWNTFDVSNE